MNIIETKKLNKVYISSTEVPHIALRDVDVFIRKENVTLIVGHSGAGKSTLMHVLGGLDRPTEGQVFFNGEELLYNNEQKISGIRNKEFGFIFQFHHLLPEFTILENILMPGRVYCEYSEKNLIARADELLDIVGLYNKKNNFYQELSGGEQQRAAVARALINDPEIIFADEPTGNLDKKNRKNIYDLLFSYVEKRNKTLVIVTHDESLKFPGSNKIRLIDGMAEQ